jgi:signal transduction histidine kinase
MPSPILPNELIKNSLNPDLSWKEVAEEAQRSHEEMISVISHDLRNPLSFIMLQVKMIEKVLKHEGYGNDKVFQKLSGVSSSCLRMNRLIQDVLDLSHIESGKLDLHLTRFSLRELVDEALSTIEESSQQSQIKLIKKSPEMDLTLFADRERLLLALGHLLSNAVKFNKPQGEITLEASSTGPDIVLTLSNTGAGISSEELPHVFERFWQGNEHSKAG